MSTATQTIPLQGLSAAQVRRRIEKGQTNAFVQKTSRSVWSILRANTFTLFNGIIFACFIIILYVGHWQDIFFALSALTNTVIGSVQEFRAKRALDSLALLNAQKITVLRNGKEQLISTVNVVLGDLLVLRAGDEIAADALVIRASRLQVDQSMLTGESDPVDKKKNHEVLSGSIIVAGEGYARVIKVGEDSFANRFAADARRFSLVASELRNSINLVLKFIAWVIGPIVIIVFNAQVMVLGGWHAVATAGLWQHAAVSTIASVVAMIPLGLVLITSVSFAIGAIRLARHNVLVKELAAVETLARVDMVCLDKTGTLTEGPIQFKKSYKLAHTASANWQAVLAWYADQPDANATTRSLAVHYTNVPKESATHEVHFSSVRKWSAVSFTSGALKGSWVLGAPEVLFSADEKQLSATNEKLTHAAHRTLVLAYSSKRLNTKKDMLPSELHPVVLLAFQETLRSDAATTLEYFKEEGVAIRIISGDNPNTVAAIARLVGLDAKKGYDARTLPEDETALQKVLRSYYCFGRVTPEQKLRMISALQSMGHTVAMTGDGVNDTLALKQADIGIAMQSGSAAAKAVSRLVLLDSQFAHLPAVVSEGRQVIANIERISMLFLSKTAYAFGLALALSIFVLPFPLLPRQESVIDGLTIGIPGVFLALLANNSRYRAGFMERALYFAIPTGIIITSAVVLYTFVSTTAHVSSNELQAGASLLIICMGLWVLVVLSRPLTLIKVGVIGTMIAGLICVFSIPLIMNFLGFARIHELNIALIGALVAVAIVLIEVVYRAHKRMIN